MRTVVSLFLVTFAALCIVAAASAQATTERIVFTETFDDVVSVECIGEPLEVTGTVTSALRSTVTPTGSLLTGGHTNADMTATGLISGDTYRVVDIREITTNIGSEALQGIGAWAFLIVGPGAGNNLLLTNQYHVTVTPNGDVTVDFLNITTKCVG